MEMYKHRALEILHRSLIPFLVVFRQFRIFVSNGFESIEEKLELVALPTAPHLTGKNVLVTGAGGFVGSQIARQLIQYQPSCILLLGHGPQSIYSVEYELRKLMVGNTEIIPIVLDVQDKKKIYSIIGRYKPDIIYHTDGHRQLDITEEDSSITLHGAVFAASNIAEAANRYQIKRFVMISTELAEKPRNLMEAEKRLSEMVVESISLTSLTRYIIVRLPEDGMSAKSKKLYSPSDTKIADAQLVQRILQTDSQAPASDLYGLKKADSSPSRGLSQIEMARLLKQLKTATENEARQLVISFLKR